MRKSSVILLFLFLLAGCNKKDVFKPGDKACKVVKYQEHSDNEPFNAFYEKTYDSRGLVTHVHDRTVTDFADVYDFDYDITYENFTTASLTGRRRTLGFYDAEGNVVTEPTVLENDESVLEAKFDPVTHLFRTLRNKSTGVVEMEFVYTNGKLSRINFPNFFFNVTVDNHNNILSIRTDCMAGLSYTYSGQGGGKNLVYEPSGSSVNVWYDLIEVLNWGPTTPNRERATLTTSYGRDCSDPNGEEYNLQHFTYYHKYDNKGNLTAISYTSNWSAFFANTFNCKLSTVNINK